MASAMVQPQGLVYSASFNPPPVGYAMAPQPMPQPMPQLMPLEPMQAMPTQMPMAALSFPGMAPAGTMPSVPTPLPTNGGIMPVPGAVFDDGSSAPFLHQYFEMVKSACAIGRTANNRAAIKELNGKLFPLIVEAFRRHDKDGDNVLIKTEAQAFFSYFVSERLGFADATRSFLASKFGNKSKALDVIQIYLNNKASMDSAAFKAMISDSDGCAQLHEVLTALSIGTDKHDALMKAFGFLAGGEDDDAESETYYEGSYH
eukprot:TRINITY_DN11023_c0_g1_i1.p1 TRINITY_DN11023_c0_g1~~TRINITY_DN11023_c0_g1_i1.p1  ORF type:complete len:268 (+),score=67.29 TRINITY_DN11023_c0_g1_i1:29-805(+)